MWTNDNQDAGYVDYTGWIDRFESDFTAQHDPTKTYDAAPFTITTKDAIFLRAMRIRTSEFTIEDPQ